MRIPFFLIAAAAALHSQTLRIYAIDVEGGKSTLYASPSGESMLVDAGYAGNNNRDANRIAAAAAAAGVKRIDYLVVHTTTGTMRAVFRNWRQRFRLAEYTITETISKNRMRKHKRCSRRTRLYGRVIRMRW